MHSFFWDFLSHGQVFLFLSNCNLGAISIMWSLNLPHRGYSHSENDNVHTSEEKILVESGMNTRSSSPFHVDIQVFCRFFPALMYYLHNCLSPPLVIRGCGGERSSPNVAVVILIDGVSGWMVPEHRASLHRHEKFLWTKCNGLINPCWVKMKIWWINS